MNRRKINLFHYFSLIASAIATLISIVILAYIKPFFYRNLLTIAVVTFQVVSMILDKLYQKKIEVLVFGGDEGKDALLRQADPDRYKNSIQGAREELRYGLKIIMVVSVACCLIWSITTFDILKPLACLCALGIAFIYADYIPHTKLYSQRYDAQFIISKEKARSNRGLARIYLQEYKETFFNKKHDLYKKCLTYEEDKDNTQQDECIKNILRIEMDTSNNYFLIFSIIIAFLNMLFILPGVIDHIVNTFIKNVTIDTSEICPVILLILNFVFFVINFAASYAYKEECDNTKLLADLICNGTPEARFKEYKDNFEKIFRHVQGESSYFVRLIWIKENHWTRSI